MDTSKNLTEVSGLPIPRRLLSLIESGRWPNEAGEAMRQNIRSIVPKERIHLFAPNEDRLYLFAPPFHTVTTRMLGSEGNFWSKYGVLDGIALELCLNIGDFGLGSDSPILLDYRANHQNPAVIRLLWKCPGPNVWVRCADDFDSFADMLGLDR